MACTASLIVPNLKLTQLEFFFKKNWRVLEAELKTRQLQLIVVTSALETEELDQWKNKYPSVGFIRIEKNYGFAMTVNVGFCLASGQWVGTVNDDVILTAGWWRSCLAAANEKTGSLNPVIFNLEGQVESAGIKVLPKGKAEPMKKVLKLDRAVVDATNGACVLYRQEALKTVGFFDRRFGSYLEDIDLSLRLTRAGWENVVCYQAKVTHLGHASSGTVQTWHKAWLDCKNWWWVILKNWSLATWLRHGPAILLERGRNLSGLFKSLNPKRSAN